MNGRTFKKWFALAAVLAAMAGTPHSLATSVIAPTFPKLVQRAELVFTGRVVEHRSEWQRIDAQRIIVTHVTFAVERVHKGSAQGTVTLQFLGGTIGEVTLEVGSMPKFQRGERAVLFVEKSAGNVSPLVGVYHGRFGVQPDASGRDIVLQHDGSALTDITEIGRAHPGGRAGKERREPLTHDDFAAKIRHANVPQ